jgi:hypothetical protein
MHMRRLWLMIVIGTAACVSSTRTEWGADAVPETDSDCATAKGTASCSESAMSEQDAASGSADWSPSGSTEAGSIGSDAGAASPRSEGGCEYLSEHFEEGVVFRSNDGCNSCQCWSGRAGCTLAGCWGHPAHCDLPFEPGSCDQAHTYYWHNPSTGICEPKTYSGCGGNLNRFEDYYSCTYLCSLSPGPGQDCSHDGQTYHHRERVVRKPSEMTGCAPCLCNDGQVLCPPADCKCPDGEKLGVQCVSCWPSGDCATEEERCVPLCGTDADCDPRYGAICDEAQGVCISPFCRGAEP